jgi:uncharacterized protein
MSTREPAPEETARRYLASRLDVGIAAVYLFGSFAAGRGHRESDLDLAVLLDRKRHSTAKDRFEVRLSLAGGLSGPRLAGREVDVVILNDAPPLLGRKAVIEGRLLLCNDPELEHAYRRDVMIRAADLEPFLRRARERKLAALRA